MDKHGVPPITIIAVAATAAFYGLYAFAQNGSRIISFVFITAFLLLCALLLSLITASAAAYLLHRRYRTQRGRNKQTLSVIRFTLCIAAGGANGAYCLGIL